MAQVFISYSRRDKDFVRRLHGSLTAQQRDAWVDWEDIPATADWRGEIENGIEAADSFIFVISPDSVRSTECTREIEHAVLDNKRFVPLLYRDIVDPADKAKMHPAISSHNWIYFRDTDNYDDAVARLATALDTDLGYVRVHTRLLIRAHEWDENKRNGSFLLQGDDLKTAEAWLAQGVGKKPTPTTLHAEYITASRQAATARQRRLLAGVTAALIVSIGLAILSLLLFGEANRQQNIAWENANAAATAQNVAQAQQMTATVAQGEALIQRATAQAAANDANTQRRVAQSISLASQAQVELNGAVPERSVLLALLAASSGYSWQAERALAYAVRDQLDKYVLSGSTNEVTGVDWSPDSKSLVTSSNDGFARVWGLDGTLRLTLSGSTDAQIRRALWSPDGRWIAGAFGDGTAQIWDAVSGQSIQVLAGHGAAVVGLAWSPDSTKLVTVSLDKTAKVWDVTSGGLISTFSGHTEAVNSADWSPDGTLIVTASVDKSARIWEAATGIERVALLGHTSPVNRAYWSKDGRFIVTASDDRTARVWDATSGEQTARLAGHTRAVNRAMWSPDGERIATASDDGTARIWNATTGQLQRTLFGHTGQVKDLIWSPGGKRLVTVSEDRTARIWDTESGGQLLVFTGHTALIYDAAWSPDGKFFATASVDQTARVWEVWSTTQKLIVFARGCCVTRPLTDEESIQFGVPTPTLLPPPAQITSCPDTLPSRLFVGGRGKVSEEGDNSALNVRHDPTVQSLSLNLLSPGQTFQVLSGPTCAGGMAWFRIIYGISAVQGWVAEGRNGVYFVEPVQQY